MSQSETPRTERAARELLQPLAGELARLSPRDLHPLDGAPPTPLEALPELLARARAAQEPWRHKRFAERLAPLLAAAREMLERRQQGMALAEVSITGGLAIAPKRGELDVPQALPVADDSIPTQDARRRRGPSQWADGGCA